MRLVPCAAIAVDDFVAAKTLRFFPDQLPSTYCRNGFVFNLFRTTEFLRLQSGLASGSGPGGRRFKSFRPDHYFPVYAAFSTSGFSIPIP
jgi:hypothetical protein